MSDANKTSIRRLYEEAVNKGNFNVVDETLATDYVYREPTAGEKRGRAGYREIVTMYRTAFPDTKFTLRSRLLRETKLSHGGVQQQHIAANSLVPLLPGSI